MGYNKEFGCAYPTNSEQCAHMKKRQARWGTRIYDFWNHSKGIAVEVDGMTHDKEYDDRHDNYNLKRSGILVLRVPNYDETVAEEVLKRIGTACTWNERRALYDRKPITT